MKKEITTLGFLESHSKGKEWIGRHGFMVRKKFRNNTSINVRHFKPFPIFPFLAYFLHNRVEILD